MEFIKDILIIDFEGNRLDGDIEASSPSQIGAILLDKKTLEEKKNFLSYIKFDYDAMTEEAKRVHECTKEDIENAPTQKEVAEKFIETFDRNVLLASWVTNMDMNFLNRLLKHVDLTVFDYDYHVLDLWPISYYYLLKKGYTGGIRSSEMFEALGVKRGDVHNALEDCRFEADILRKVFLSN